jgi:hypothetical protein
MRIGLVLFGHLRSFRSTHDSFQQFLKALQQSGDVDVFCHTWDIEESITASWWKEHQPGDVPLATVDAKEIEERYKPVRYLIEPSRQFDVSGYDVRSGIPVAGILSMLHSQWQAFQLLKQYSKEKNVQYDVIIKSRYDLLYEIAPGFSNTINDAVTNNCLYLPTSNPYELGGSFSDVFVLGPVKLVGEYFSFASGFKQAVEDYLQMGYQEFLPELCLTLYLKREKINIQELTRFRVHILRMNGDQFQINTDKTFTNNKPQCFFGESIKANKRILPGQNNIIAENSEKLVKKYMSWVDAEATKETLQQYADLYNGKWIGVPLLKRLLFKTKNNSVFSPHVMKSFFEETIHNAKYSRAKKILLASVLTAFGEYGLFFFRVLKNTSFRKS